MTTRARFAPFFGLAVGCGLLTLFACQNAILGEYVGGCDAGACEADEAHEADASFIRDDAFVCPTVAVPACDAGSPVEQRGTDGCVVGYRCTIACASQNGVCKTRPECAGGRWSTDPRYDCSATASDISGGGNIACCMSCPSIGAPSADYCDGGPIAQVYEGDCLVGFACN